VIEDTRHVIEWTFEHFERVAMTSAFGLSGMALIHILREMGHKVPVLFVDTGLMFDETLALKEDVVDMGVTVITYSTDGNLPTPCDKMRKHEPCVLKDRARIVGCCEVRKVEPMRKLLDEFAPDVILTARGRFQAETRRSLGLYEPDRHPPRINPLACWMQEEVRSFVKENDVPYSPLYDQGYPSVGCWPCTRPVEEGADVRSGRWDRMVVECGIWR
jgi:phosphoadenosine phosphosulfate reductase